MGQVERPDPPMRAWARRSIHTVRGSPLCAGRAVSAVPVSARPVWAPWRWRWRGRGSLSVSAPPSGLRSPMAMLRSSPPPVGYSRLRTRHYEAREVVTHFRTWLQDTGTVDTARSCVCGLRLRFADGRCVAVRENLVLRSYLVRTDCTACTVPTPGVRSTTVTVDKLIVM